MKRDCYAQRAAKGWYAINPAVTSARPVQFFVLATLIETVGILGIDMHLCRREN
jgi:F0F1-type ATP synthase membrane subunit c/vacuolar-type H+-ATPase subunit K